MMFGSSSPFKGNFLSRCIAIASVGVVAPSAYSADQATRQLEEVVVSAQRRSESMQDVPIAVSALSADEMADQGILDTESLGQAIPGLVISTQDGRFFPRLCGVGNSLVSAGYESGIATYVDGVYYASATTGAMALSNVERIEVVKGPQGTLFGRNATGGLIQVVTKKPSSEFGGDVSLTYANYDTWTTTGYVTGGSDSVAADIAFHYSEQGEGWGTNLANGEDVYKLDDESVVRASLMFTPTDVTEIRLAIDANDSYSSMSAIRPIDGFVYYPFLAQPTATEDHDVAMDHQPITEYKGSGFSAHILHEFDSATLTSITAFRESELFYAIDSEGSATPYVNLDFFQEDEQFSLELQLSDNGSADFTWVAGLYYFDGEAQWNPFKLYVSDVARAADPNFGGVVETVTLRPLLTNQAYAVYAQTMLPVSEQTDLTLGVRYSDEERTIESHESATGTAGGVSFPLSDDSLPEKSESYDEITYRVAVDHAFTDDFMGYVSFNTGFKSGGFNANQYADAPYQPETIDAWELGMKSSLLDDRLRLNVAGFFYVYDDIQFGRFENGTTFFYNAAEAEIRGMEVDFEALVTESLSFTGGLSLLDTEFTESSDNIVNHRPNHVFGGNDETRESVKGNDLPKAPDLTLSLAAQYFVSLGSGVTLPLFLNQFSW